MSAYEPMQFDDEGTLIDDPLGEAERRQRLFGVDRMTDDERALIDAMSDDERAYFAAGFPLVYVPPPRSWRTVERVAAVVVWIAVTLALAYLGAHVLVAMGVGRA